MAALKIGDSRGSDRFLPDCTHTSYYMIFVTDFLRKLLFRDLGNLALKRHKQK